MDFEKHLCEAIDLITDGEDEKARSIMSDCVKGLQTLKKNNTITAQHWMYWGTIMEIQEEWEQAILKYESALNVDPSLLDAWLKIGQILLYNMEKPDAAQKVLKEKILPLSGEGHPAIQEFSADLSSFLRRNSRLQSGIVSSTPDQDLEKI